LLVTLKWLKEYVDIEESAEEIADMLTHLGLEVSGCSPIKSGFEKVVTSRIISVDPHPNADKLTVCRVNNGVGEETIVCGARNIQAGDTVPLALPGARLPGEKVIEAAEVRGIQSAGMLCSESELDLCEDHQGIMILPSETALGQPLSEVLALDDDLLELEITPNRPDCLSVIGIAREIAAKKRSLLRLPAIELMEDGPATDQLCSVGIQADDACHRYVARVIEGVTLGPSPFWLRRLLTLVGIRPISNIVDVTNFVMWEWGQPLHAFDLDCLKGQQIIVRRAGSGEQMNTLDGQARRLVEEDLLICDAGKPVALAGVMGGLESEISGQTTRILLESAFFEPRGIRRTSKRLGLSTESSYRFEREIDKEGTCQAANRACSLILSLAGGRLAKGALDVFPRPYQPEPIRLDISRMNRLLGTAIDKARVIDFLSRIEVKCQDEGKEDDGALSALAPAHRPDIRAEIDLVEEVARMYGYDEIPTDMPKAAISVVLPDAEKAAEEKIRNTLVGLGFYEAINYSFMGSDRLNLLNMSEEEGLPPLALQNPLSESQAFMRTTLVGSLLETIARNHRRRNLDLKLFELRKVFLPVVGCSQPREIKMASGAITGRRCPQQWHQAGDDFDIYDLKGVLEALKSAFRIKNFDWKPTNKISCLHPGCSGDIFIDAQKIGYAGMLHPEMQEAFEIDKEVFLFEMALEGFVSHMDKQEKYSPFSRFPAVQRDVALILDERLTWNGVLEKVTSLADPRAVSIDLFDVYSGAPIPEGKKSVGFRITYQDTGRSLTDEEVNGLQAEFLDALLPALPAQLR